MALAEPSRVEVVERMTAAQFLQLALEEEKVELINGVIVMDPPPLDTHEQENLFLLHLIRAFAEENDLGAVRGSRTAVRLSEAHVFEPDLLFVEESRTDIIQERGVFGAPDLVVEILSASTAARDRGDKFHAYDKAGVRELWLIDPYGPAGTEFYQRQGETLAPVSPDGDGWLTALALQGFRLQTKWLWPREKFIPVQKALEIVEALNLEE